MDEDKIKKRIVKFLDLKYSNSKVVKEYKQLFIDLMTYAYLAAVHDMSSQDLEDNIDIT